MWNVYVADHKKRKIKVAIKAPKVLELEKRNTKVGVMLRRSTIANIHFYL